MEPPEMRCVNAGGYLEGVNVSEEAVQKMRTNTRCELFVEPVALHQISAGGAKNADFHETAFRIFRLAISQSSN